ncbi:alpha/beta family hydrolase [Polymorphum gilvum]|uniref:Predicted hydrolase of the alpha/beta-hydrolase fold protein n=1 Tax=Polymorphum gilvum (strain LMG 25793 / CGMCC 1.9160 / SL003B-26A1) TaxID=991905 RepID=F2IY78_POLGS|nr:alpha/beta family hydrolase [Polymorphum gilvum]ADZ71690.1 Predicted hydrolase of the alpha/beta-hydrolase fold protein [Polymorphum gilvum SL003B-26A1]
MTDFLWTRPSSMPSATLLLAHGAGAPMDSAFMTRLAEALTSEGVAVARFEFPYMAARRSDGRKLPPPRAEKLIGAFQTAVQTVLHEVDGPLLIGGKSMGGRVAAMLAGGASLPGRVLGVVCVGYPFHPTAKPEHWRLEPLQQASRPVLIAQGERDPFGSRAELEAVSLPANVEIVFLEDGNHDLGPRGQSPATWDGNIGAAARSIADFARRLGSRTSA